MVKLKMEGKTNDLIFDIKKLKKEVRAQIVLAGLDERMSSDVISLKKELLNMVNRARLENKNPTTPETDEPKLTISQSESELIKHFTGLDVETIKKNKDFTKLVENKVAFVRRDSNMLGNDPQPSRMTPGISYRLDMSQYDTFESQQSKALDYFNNSIYVIEEGSKRLFFVNPGGLDLSQFIKVVCTRDTGDSAAARERFEKYRNGNGRQRNSDTAGFADWTLRKEGIEFIKKNFVDLTDVIDKIQNGEEDEAIASANMKTGRSTALSSFQEKVQEVKDRKDLPPTTEAYLNIIKLIKNIQLQKRINDQRAQYSLITSDPASNDPQEEEFLEKIQSTISLWEISKQEKWVQALIRKINKLVQKYVDIRG